MASRTKSGDYGPTLEKLTDAFAFYLHLPEVLFREYLGKSKEYTRMFVYSARKIKVPYREIALFLNKTEKQVDRMYQRAKTRSSLYEVILKWIL